MSSPNFLSKVAIVGAGGNSGGPMAKELLKTGKHIVTAISRIDSQSELPSGVKVARVDYKKYETLVDALKDQDVLVITMSVFADHSQQGDLIKAASEAGVKWIVPNDWAPDTQREDVVKDVAPFQGQVSTRKLIEGMGLSHLSISCGFWWEWSLAIPSAFGIDIPNRTATLFDEGETKISTSTWPQVGRAVAAVLSLPVKPEDGGKPDACLEAFRNKNIYINSFTVSQNEMLESVLRVTGTKEADWKISKEPVQDRYKNGLEAMKKGDRQGFARMMYSRIFYPDGNGDFEKSRGVSNGLLGLPKENIDEATVRAVERAKSGSGF